MNTKFNGGAAYEMVGQGPCVVLIHGLGLNWQMWQWLVPVLGIHHRIVTYDLLGHGGQRDRPNRDL